MNRRDDSHEVFVAVDPEAFVHDEARRVVGFKFVEGGAVILPGAERRRGLVPETGLEHELPGVEHVGVVEHLVGEVVLCRNSEGRRLDAHVDVLRHQHDGALGEGFSDALDGGEYPVVALREVELSGEIRLKWLRFKPEKALRFRVPEERERHARINLSFIRFNQGVERAAHRTGVSRDVGEALLVVVELLERRHRKEDVVLGEAEERERVVHEDVRVENEEPGLAVGYARAAFAACKRPLDAGRRRAAARKCGGILLRARRSGARRGSRFRLRRGLRPGFGRSGRFCALCGFCGFCSSGHFCLLNGRGGFRFLCLWSLHGLHRLLFGNRSGLSLGFGRNRRGRGRCFRALAGLPRCLFGLGGLGLPGGFRIIRGKCNDVLHFGKRSFGLRFGGGAVVLKNVCGA